MPKVVPVVILVLVLSEACLASFPSGCEMPKNAINITLQQLGGTVWFAQRIINGGGRFPLACAQGHWVSRVDRHSLTKSFPHNVVPAGGIFVNDVYEVTRSFEDGSFRNQNLKNKSMVYYDYIVRFDNYFIESVCITMSGKFAYQGFLVWTKDGKADRATLDQVVKHAGIEVTDTYDVPQSDNCFKFSSTQ